MDPTERVSDVASREPDDGLEWLPREIEQELRLPRFTRLTTDERVQRRRQQGRGDGAPRTRRFMPQRIPARGITAVAEPAPTPPAVSAPAAAPAPAASEMLRRLSEVEAKVARAARAVDRSASNVRTIVEGNGDLGEASG